MKRTKGQFAPTRHFKVLGYIYLALLFLLIIAGSTVRVEYEFISPLPARVLGTVDQIQAQEPDPCGDVDCWINKYSSKFSKSEVEAMQIKVKLHFLAYKESKYGSDTNCGDSGKACGPLQFHEPTWQGYRKIMLKEGLIDEIGSRLDMEQVIETTAWAIATGRETAWGPIKRGEINL